VASFLEAIEKGSKMKQYSLYVKTHSVTGLRYLGQTSKSDPHKYTGSGKYWLRHLKKHGKIWTTEILWSSDNKQKINEMGIYYSNLWNVVESNDWANLKPESGDGAASGIYNPMKNPLVFEKQQTIVKSLEVKEKHRLATINAMNRPEVKEKLRLARNTIEYKNFLKTTLNKPELLLNRTADNNSHYNHATYKFKHTSGVVEHCTSFELRTKYNLPQPSVSRLVSGEYKISKGWQIIV
jgi:hypothetical protein